MKTPFVFSLIFIFSLSSFSILPVKGNDSGVTVLPQPGTMIHLSPAFTPSYLQGLTIQPNNPFQFEFLVNQGQGQLSNDEKKEEYGKLVKYFLASLTVPDNDQWVNLSPYEKDRIIADNFSKTAMGRDLLAQDYLLKQITSSLMYPESTIGKTFWDNVYAKALKEFGTTNIPVNTFNKVWIIPDQAAVYESGNTVYILRNHLKVMLEEDYLARSLQGSHPERSEGSKFRSFVAKNAPQDDARNITNQIVRQIILPELEKEINEGKNFAQLRQIYSGMILATWYKHRLKDSILNKVYTDKNKTSGIQSSLNALIGDPNQIYQQYLAAYKKGVYNYIKEEPDPATGKSVPRKYFSGGTVGFHGLADPAMGFETGKLLILDKRNFPSVIDRTSLNLDPGQEMDRVSILVRDDPAMQAADEPDGFSQLLNERMESLKLAYLNLDSYYRVSYFGRLENLRRARRVSGALNESEADLTLLSQGYLTREQFDVFQEFRKKFRGLPSYIAAAKKLSRVQAAGNISIYFIPTDAGKSLFWNGEQAKIYHVDSVAGAIYIPLGVMINEITSSMNLGQVYASLGGIGISKINHIMEKIAFETSSSELQEYYLSLRFQDMQDSEWSGQAKTVDFRNGKSRLTMSPIKGPDREIRNFNDILQSTRQDGWSAVAIAVSDLPEEIKDKLMAYRIGPLAGGNGRSVNYWDILSRYVDEVVFTPFLMEYESTGVKLLPVLNVLTLHPAMEQGIRGDKKIVIVSSRNFTDGLKTGAPGSQDIGINDLLISLSTGLIQRALLDLQVRGKLDGVDIYREGLAMQWFILEQLIKQLREEYLSNVKQTNDRIMQNAQDLVDWLQRYQRWIEGQIKVKTNAKNEIYTPATRRVVETLINDAAMLGIGKVVGGWLANRGAKRADAKAAAAQEDQVIADRARSLDPLQGKDAKERFQMALQNYDIVEARRIIDYEIADSTVKDELTRQVEVRNDEVSEVKTRFSKAINASDLGSARQFMHRLTAEMRRAIHPQVLAQLNSDLQALQIEKERLLGKIRELRNHYEFFDDIRLSPKERRRINSFYAHDSDIANSIKSLLGDKLNVFLEGSADTVRLIGLVNEAVEIWNRNHPDDQRKSVTAIPRPSKTQLESLRIITHDLPKGIDGLNQKSFLDALRLLRNNVGSDEAMAADEEGEDQQALVARVEAIAGAQVVPGVRYFPRQIDSGFNVQSMTLEQAYAVLQDPRLLGQHDLNVDDYTPPGDEMYFRLGRAMSLARITVEYNQRVLLYPRKDTDTEHRRVEGILNMLLKAKMKVEEALTTGGIDKDHIKSSVAVHAALLDLIKEEAQRQGKVSEGNALEIELRYIFEVGALVAFIRDRIYPFLHDKAGSWEPEQIKVLTDAVTETADPLLNTKKANDLKLEKVLEFLNWEDQFKDWSMASRPVNEKIKGALVDLVQTRGTYTNEVVRQRNIQMVMILFRSAINADLMKDFILSTLYLHLHDKTKDSIGHALEQELMDKLSLGENATEEQVQSNIKYIYALLDMPYRYPAQGDSAMTAPGGIDMNARHLDLLIKRDGQGVVLPLAQQDLAQFEAINGLVPMIINIQPVTQFPIVTEIKSMIQ